MTSRKFWGFLDPLPPLVTHFGLIIVLNPRNLPYYVMFWTTPLPPLERDVIYGWSLSVSLVTANSFGGREYRYRLKGPSINDVTLKRGGGGLSKT